MFEEYYADVNVNDHADYDHHYDYDSDRQLGGVDMSNAHWRLHGCCDAEEKTFIILYVLYWFVTLALWRTPVLKPLKLLAVLVHELGHGSAAVLTCGSMKSISVNADESGLASYSGGIQAVVIPGGYVGGAFWGAAFVCLSGNRIGATVAASLISIVLVSNTRVSLSFNDADVQCSENLVKGCLLLCSSL